LPCHPVLANYLIPGEGFTLALTFSGPKPFFNCGGQGCRIISDEINVKAGRVMKLLRLTGLGFACLITIFLISGESRGEKKWITYKGAWFEIEYPSGFKVKPAQKSATSTIGYDSVYFISPDNNVVFYVFSPQWQGKARETDIEINPNSEELIEQNVTKEQDQVGKFKTIRTFTVKAKDNSYVRAIRDETTDTTRLVFGIKYKSKEFYNEYYNDYLLFKKSLRQLSD
jgi:hypothetical protein